VQLTLLPGTYSVCRLAPDAPWPAPPIAAGLFAATRTEGELSLVCPEAMVPPGARAERGFRALRVEGPLDFALTGILAELSGTLAAAGVSLFAISTFDTDYLLVRETALPHALAALRAKSHEVISPRP
jgi:hypothetical protein